MNNLLIKSFLKIVHWNCYHLDAIKLVELKLFINKFEPDLISLQEVKLNQEQANLFLRLDSYTLYYKPRICNPTRGGGVAILVNNSIISTKIEGLDNNLEIVGVKIETVDFSFNLVSYYEPKGNNLSTDAIESFLELGPNIIMVGDLNSKAYSIGCKSLNQNGLFLEEILSNSELVVVNDKFSPTYFSRSYSDYAEILDLIICSSLMYKYTS